MPGFDDLRFEGEWRFVQSLKSRTKKESHSSSLGLSTSSRPSVMNLFGSPDRKTSLHQVSPNASPSKAYLSMSLLRKPPVPTLRTASASTHQTDTCSPQTVAAILSSTLSVLQLYEFAGHPAIVIQAFSQLLYWLASELFNRILARVS